MTSRKQPAPKKKQKPRASPRKMNTFRHQFDQILRRSEDSAKRTPLPLLVIASYLNRLDFIETINRNVRWDPAQWKYSPGILAQLLVIATFIPANKKTALSQIHQVYAGMWKGPAHGYPIHFVDLGSSHRYPQMLKYGSAHGYPKVILFVSHCSCGGA